MTAEESSKKYIMGSDTEVHRLNVQHEVLTESMNGLVMCPIDLSRPNLRILDSATADGRWLRDLQASTDHGHEYFGTDVVKENFPKAPTEGITLQLQSFIDPWPQEWRGSFDYVHQRFALGSAFTHPVQDIVVRMMELLKPGGWIELAEGDFTSQGNDDSAVGQALGLAREIFDIVGVGHTFWQNIKGWLIDAGLEEVGDKMYHIQVGRSASNPTLAEKSSMGMVWTAETLVNGSKRLPKPVSLSQEQLDTLPDRVAKEVEVEGGSYKTYVVWGRKPLAKSI